MDEKLSYKEFLDHNESWPMDDRDLCLEAQPAFQPVPMGALRSTPHFTTGGTRRCPSSVPQAGFVLSYSRLSSLGCVLFS